MNNKLINTAETKLVNSFFEMILNKKDKETLYCLSGKNGSGKTFLFQNLISR